MKQRPTLFALSSGRPPAAIAVVRISGPCAIEALARLTRRPLPEARLAVMRTLRSPSTGGILDKGLVIVFPGPRTATGEDLVELHLHGGIAVVSAVLDALGDIDGLQPAEPGAFTRRAFENGVLDLAQVEGLADLLAAETERQRRQAIAHADGHLSRLVDGWRERLLDLLAQVEAELDFSDEDDVSDASVAVDIDALAAELGSVLERPSGERLREGIRLVIVGAPNTGKSSLINILSGRDVAIVTPVAGTTRDRIEAHLSIDGIPFVATDTAGLRETEDPVEREGIARARAAVATADIIITMADDSGRFEPIDAGVPVFRVFSKADLREQAVGEINGVFHLSAVTGAGINELTSHLVREAERLVGHGEVLALANDRQRRIVGECRTRLLEASAAHGDPLLVAESLRQALSALGRLTGRVGVEDMLDALFGRFCIGK